MKYLLILCFALATFTQCSTANQPVQSKAELDQLVTSKRYTFMAQYALPVGSRQIPLNTVYTLTVRNDSLVSNLPYFGRAFVAPINSSDGGLNFTTTHFTYTVQNSRKGGYTMTMDIEGERNASRMILTITSSGFANLQVLSPYRQAISFRGILQPVMQ